MSVADKYGEFISVMDDCTDSYMFVFDLTNDTYFISEKALETFALQCNSFDNATAVIKEIVYPPDFCKLEEDVYRLKNGYSKNHSLEYRWFNKSGNPVWISCRGKVFCDDGVMYLVGSITERGKLHKYDNNTSLYSESVLENDYKAMMSAGGSEGFILLIGVDNFRTINEKFGMNKGDKVLADVAMCINECIDNSYRGYRLKGDEFAILKFGSVNNPLDIAKSLYKKIRSRIDSYIEMKQFSTFYTISGGAVSFDCSVDSFDKTMKNLRFALHSAKMKGRNTFSAYSDESYATYIRRMDIQEELRRCIINNFEGFEVYYQPVVKASDKKLYGAEALIRWNNKTYGSVSPVDFIPLLEASSLIIPLGKWIIEQAVMQCKEWMKQVPDFVMNINLSFVQILKSDLLKDVLECVDYHGIEHKHIVFEATESGELESNKTVRNVLDSLNNNCFKLAIDDFGTGYSNLRYIRDMVFSIIKIDRMFVKNIDTMSDNYTLVKYMIEMAHNLNLNVCVEGVETENELSQVVNLGADCIQGYYYGKPMPKQEFADRFMSDGNLFLN